MDDLCVFTANADELLVESGRRVGIEVASYSCEWKGYVTGKLKRGVEFLSGRTEQFAMWVDGHDTLILKPADEILARLMVYGFPVVISAERNCWPDADKSHLFPKRDGGVPQFWNAGGFIGLRSEVVTVMHRVIQCAEDEDDMRAWTNAIPSGIMNTVQIDYARRLFTSEGDGDTDGADPCVRHWNGRTPGRQEFWEKWTA